MDRLSQPEPGSQPLAFESEHAQSLFGQYCVLLRKGTVSYWRNPGYNAVRFTFTVLYGVLMGAAFWALGSNRCAPCCSAHSANSYQQESGSLSAIGVHISMILLCLHPQ